MKVKLSFSCWLGRSANLSREEPDFLCDRGHRGAGSHLTGLKKPIWNTEGWREHVGKADKNGGVVPLSDSHLPWPRASWLDDF